VWGALSGKVGERLTLVLKKQRNGAVFLGGGK